METNEIEVIDPEIIIFPELSRRLNNFHYICSTVGSQLSPTSKL